MFRAHLLIRWFPYRMLVCPDSLRPGFLNLSWVNPTIKQLGIFGYYKMRFIQIVRYILLTMGPRALLPIGGANTELDSERLND